MKVDAAMQQEAQKKEDIPLLPLVPVKQSYKKGDTVTFKLRLTPTDVDSPMYEVTMPHLCGTEDLRSILEFKVNVTKIFIGMREGRSVLLIINNSHNFHFTFTSSYPTFWLVHFVNKHSDCKFVP